MMMKLIHDRENIEVDRKQILQKMQEFILEYIQKKTADQKRKIDIVTETIIQNMELEMVRVEESLKSIFLNKIVNEQFSLRNLRKIENLLGYVDLFRKFFSNFKSRIFPSKFVIFRQQLQKEHT